MDHFEENYRDCMNTFGSEYLETHPVPGCEGFASFMANEFGTPESKAKYAPDPKGPNSQYYHMDIARKLVTIYQKMVYRALTPEQKKCVRFLMWPEIRSLKRQGEWHECYVVKCFEMWTHDEFGATMEKLLPKSFKDEAYQIVSTIPGLTVGYVLGERAPQTDGLRIVYDPVMAGAAIERSRK